MASSNTTQLHINNITTQIQNGKQKLSIESLLPVGHVKEKLLDNSDTVKTVINRINFESKWSAHTSLVNESVQYSINSH